MSSVSDVPLSSVSLEVANTLVASFLLTEVLLKGRRLWELRVVLGAWVTLNILLSLRVQAIFGGALTFVRGDGIDATPRPTTEATGVLANIAAPLVSPYTRGLLRLTALAMGFATLVYLDVRRLRQDTYSLRDFGRELRAALRLVLPVFPVLIIGFSCVFLIVVSVFQKLGLPEHIGAELIFYGQFYAPFSAVYWIIKKDWLAKERQSSILPTATDGQGRRLGGGLGGRRLT